MKIDAIVACAERQCRDHGERLTAKRKQVLSGLLHAGTALSAYELADLYQERFGESMAAMSVYRILNFLEKENLVHKLKLNNKFIACSHIACDHEHQTPQFLICHECQRVQEIGIDKSIINDLEQNVERAGFSLLSPQIEMSCICRECRS